MNEEGLFQAISDLRSDIGKLRTDMAVIKTGLDDIADHERRIRALESRVWAAIGVFGLVAAASPYLSRLIP